MFTTLFYIFIILTILNLIIFIANILFIKLPEVFHANSTLLILQMVILSILLLFL